MMAACSQAYRVMVIAHIGRAILRWGWRHAVS